MNFGLKPDRTFNPPSLFCFVSVHRTPSILHQRGSPQRLYKWNGIGFFSAAQIWSLTCYHVGRP